MKYNHLKSTFLNDCILAFIVFVFLAGCAMGGMVTYSKMTVPQKQDSNGLLKLPGLSISVIPYNFYSPVAGFGIIVPVIPVGGQTKSEHSERSMHISIEFEVERGTFVLEPQKIILRHNDQEYIPTKMSRRYEGRPYRRSHSAGAVPGHDWECDYKVHRINASELQDIKETIVTEKTCYMFEFKTKTIHPKEDFSLIINGLKNENGYLAIPELFFKPETSYESEIIGN